MAPDPNFRLSFDEDRSYLTSSFPKLWLSAPLETWAPSPKPTASGSRSSCFQPQSSLISTPPRSAPLPPQSSPTPLFQTSSYSLPPPHFLLWLYNPEAALVPFCPSFLLQSLLVVAVGTNTDKILAFCKLLLSWEETELEQTTKQ